MHALGAFGCHVNAMQACPASRQRWAQALALLSPPTSNIVAFTTFSPKRGGAPPQRDMALLARDVAAAVQRGLPADAGCAARWLHIDAVQLARYFTLVDEHLYRAVDHGHLLSYVWRAHGSHDAASAKAPLLRWQQRFNEVANLIASALVSTPALETRARLFGHFVRLAAALRALQNFNGLFAIAAGLGLASVHRLKHTKARLAPLIGAYV